MTKTVTSTMTTVNVLSTYTPIPGPALDMLVIGDWGTDVDDQFNVAKQMERWASALQSDKVISLGDNFYQGDATYDGIATANDVKFITYWKNVYNGTYLSTLKWWTVLGNHDWYSVGSDAYELMFNDDKWVMPDFFYIKRKQVDDGVFATFIFIETDLFEYGVQAKNKGMQQNFASQGWDQNTNLKQLAWIENAIAQSNKDQYIIVVGHHPTYTCAGDVTDDLGSLYNIINTWNVSAYMNGHSHSMAGYLTNNNRTLQVQAGSGGQTSSTC
ncbi:Metallo-dependent phosphatase, partial [Rhizoclosmatium globosum]